MDDNFKKIFFCRYSSIYYCSCADVVNSPEVDYLWFPSDSMSKSLYYLLHPKIIDLLPLTVQRTIYAHTLRYDFLRLGRDRRLLFVFHDGYEMFAYPAQFVAFIKFLHRWFPYAKFTLYRYEAINDCSRGWLSTLSNLFDLNLTFSRYDAEKYSELEYYGGICEHDLVPYETDVDDCDLFFAGTPGSRRGPQRLEWIIEIFRRISEHGKKCIFYLDQVTDKEKDKLLSISEISRGG